LKPIPSDYLEKWMSIVDQQKEFAGWPDWSRDPPESRRKKGRSRPVLVPNRDAYKCVVVFPLALTGGIGLEGVRLRLKVSQTRMLSDMTATLEVPDWKDSLRCIQRYDANPSSPHVNRHWRRLAIPAEIQGTHLHPLSLNSRLGLEAWLQNDLPAAIEVDGNIPSFKEFARKVEEHFRVTGIVNFPSPPWQERLDL
jgi:hypothetical protein